MQTSVQHTLSAAVLILRHWLSVTIGCDWNTTVVKKTRTWKGRRWSNCRR